MMMVYRALRIIMASFNTTMRQMTEMFQRKKNRIKSRLFEIW